MIRHEWKIGDTALVVDYVSTNEPFTAVRTHPVKIVGWRPEDATDGRNQVCAVEFPNGVRGYVHVARLSRVEEELKTTINDLVSQYGWSAVASEVSRHAPYGEVAWALDARRKT